MKLIALQVAAMLRASNTQQGPAGGTRNVSSNPLQSQRAHSSHGSENIPLNTSNQPEFGQSYGDHVSGYARSIPASQVSGTSQRSRIQDDFEMDASKQSEKIFTKTLALLQDVLGDRLPVRPTISSNLVSMSDRGDSLCQNSEKKCFPHSGLIKSSFLHVMEGMTGAPDTDMSDPSKLPDQLDSRVMTDKGVRRLKVPSYHDNFYSTKNDVFSTAPPEVDTALDTHVFGKKATSWKTSHTITPKDLMSLEKSQRRTMCCISSMDVLVDALQTLIERENLPDETAEHIQDLFQSLSRSIAHASAHSAQGIAQSMIARRRAYLEAAGNKIPKPIHEWLLCQPLVADGDKPSSLFGNVTGQVRDFKQQEDKAAANVSLASLKRSSYNNQRGRHTDNKPDFKTPTSTKGKYDRNKSGRGKRNSSGRGGTATWIGGFGSSGNRPNPRRGSR